jgi:hypothetical protein
VTNKKDDAVSDCKHGPEPKPQRKSTDIQAAAPGALRWASDQVPLSLERLLTYVENEAAETIGWYWRSKRWKALLSRWIRLWALVLTALAGLVPIAFYILKDTVHWSAPVLDTSGLWSSALVGVAAALVGLDRAFGFSSGWARYVLAATDIRRRLEEFRMDWIALAAVTGPDPSTEQIAPLIQRAKEFRIAVEGVVAQETKDWVTEFQNSMAQLEKDVKAQLDALKIQVDRTQEVQVAAAQPGSLEITIDNAERTENFTFFVTLEGADGFLVKAEKVSGDKTWGRVNIAPGQYRLVINATRAGANPVSSTRVVTVNPLKVTTEIVTLPLG